MAQNIWMTWRSRLVQIAVWAGRVVMGCEVLSLALNRWKPTCSTQPCFYALDIGSVGTEEKCVFRVAGGELVWGSKNSISTSIIERLKTVESERQIPKRVCFWKIRVEVRDSGIPFSLKSYLTYLNLALHNVLGWGERMGGGDKCANNSPQRCYPSVSKF